MITWNNFAIFGFASIIFGVAASVCVLLPRNMKRVVVILSALQIFVLLAFIVGFWIFLQRPPMRTMGETRLWFSLFMPVAGLLTYKLWNYKLIIPYSTLLSAVFIIINIFKPEIHSKVLMPALQSVWFVPHVAIYMFAYAFLGGAFLLAMILIFSKKNDSKIVDNLVVIGISALTIGMLFGALWAKEAWGHYWAWDAKETWALITWLAYALYLHLRFRNSNKKIAIIVLVVAFAALQICWYGINYLPSAQTSAHTYTMGN